MASSITQSSFTPDAYNDLHPREGAEGRGEIVRKALIGLITASAITAGALGNFLVCIVVLCNPQMRKKSHSFIASLAVADILITLLVKPFALHSELNDDRWPFGAVFCWVWISVDITCCTVSILHLCLISLDRYVHIRCPMTYDRWMTKQRVVTSIAAVWITSALLSFVLIYLGCHTDHEHAAHDDVCLFDMAPVYAVGSSLVSFYVPCVVLLVIYSRLFAHARRHQKMLSKLTTPSCLISPSRLTLPSRLTSASCLTPPSGLAPPSRLTLPSRLTPTKASVRIPEPYYAGLEITVDASTCSLTTVVAGKGCAVQPVSLDPQILGTPTSSNSGTRDKIRRLIGKRSNHKAILTVGIVMGAFLVCWLPFFIVYPIAAYHPGCIGPLPTKIVTWLGWFNSCLNPFIYSVTDTAFRKAFHRLLCQRRC